MLELKTVSWKNFLSYGNYLSTLDLTNLGQCLITGEVIDDSKDTYDDANPMPVRRSNGSGKSSLPSVIQWVLFGRTMHSPNPGSKILNWFTGENCWGKIEFKSGDSITRIRTTEGNTELIYVRDGNEEKLAATTLSTAVNQQAQLARLFSLDWDFFCGSAFFNQYSRPWLEMADQSRRQVIERALHVDRYAYRAQIAKAKYDATEKVIEYKKQRIENSQSEIARLQTVITNLQDAITKFEQGRASRKQLLLQHAADEQQKRDKLVVPDLDKLRKKWAIVEQIQTKLNSYRDMELDIYRNISDLQGKEKSIEDRIATWQRKSGNICISCEQTIPAGHIAARIEPLQQELEAVVIQITEANAEREKIANLILQIKQAVASKQPEHTIRDATQIHNEYKSLTREIERLKAEAVKPEQNPHQKSLQDAERLLKGHKDLLTKLQKEIDQDIFTSRHLLYIHRAYNDRNKIKSFAFQEHIPFINGRLKHYLEVFGLNIEISLTPSLGIASNLWGYEFESGGERKRTDVAFMLAMFDFHEHMYGRQCNVLVLDEVDGRLDDDGIDSLINIIKTDLGTRAESILIISHRNHMQDVFPKEIRVVKSNGLSRLAESGEA